MIYPWSLLSNKKLVNYRFQQRKMKKMFNTKFIGLSASTSVSGLCWRKTKELFQFDRSNEAHLTDLLQKYKAFTIHASDFDCITSILRVYYR